MDNYMELEELVSLFIERGGVITLCPCAQEDGPIAYAMKLGGMESMGDASSLRAILLEGLALEEEEDYGINTFDAFDDHLMTP